MSVEVQMPPEVLRTSIENSKQDLQLISNDEVMQV